MATRPVFIPEFDGPLLVRTENVEFEWFPGLTVAQKQRSIDALHTSAQKQCGLDAILEVSSKSRQAVGTHLSAFNLALRTETHPDGLSVECAFQSSKVFEQGGPYYDILDMTSRDAKRDARLQHSGRLIGFRFGGVDWPLQPLTAFYDWLYLSALSQGDGWLDRIAGYEAFTDIEFNPGRSLNCQAYAIALYASLSARGQLGAVAQGRDAFIGVVGGRPVSYPAQDNIQQGTLF